MDAVLQKQRFKVVGAIENKSWREKFEAQKKARAERKGGIALEKYNAKQQARMEREAKKEALAEAELQERVRKKVLLETYKQLGIDENYLKQKKAWVEGQEAKNHFADDELSVTGHLERTESIAAGAGMAAGSDEKARQNAVLDFSAGLFGQGSFRGAMASGGALAGGYVGAFAGPAGAVIGAVVGALMINLPLTIVTTVRKGKMKENNLADQAEKLEVYKAELAEYELKVNGVISKLQGAQAMISEKYKTMKKAEFNEFLESFISSVLAEYGLTKPNIQKVANSMVSGEQKQSQNNDGGDQHKSNSDNQNTKEEKTASEENTLGGR